MSGRFLVCEKSGQWAMALRWAAGSLPLRLYELRSLSDCAAELQQYPASFVGVEARMGNIEEVMHLIIQVHDRYSRARVVVFTERALQRWEDTLREAGALHVAFSTRRLDWIARMAQGHLPPVVQPNIGFREEVQSRMPWRDD